MYAGLSAEYKDAIKAETRNWGITLGLNVASQAYAVNIPEDDIVLGSVKYSEAVMPSDSFALGGGILSEFSVTLINRDKYAGVQFKEAILSPTILFYALPAWFPDEVPLGQFVIDDVTRTETTISLRGFDFLSKADIPFKQKPKTSFTLQNGSLPRHTENIFGTADMYPCTLLELMTSIETHCGLTRGGETHFLNDDYVLTALPEGDPSCRDVICWVAQIACCWVRTNRLGEIEFVPIYTHNPQYIAEAAVDGDTDDADGGAFDNLGTMPYDGGVFDPPVVDITTEPASRYDLSVGSDPVTITGVKYEANDAVYLAGSDKYAVDLSDNKLIQLTDISGLLRFIAPFLVGYTYIPYTANWIGDPAVQAGDLVEHTDRSGRTYRSVVAETKFAYRGKATLSAGGVAESANKY